MAMKQLITNPMFRGSTMPVTSRPVTDSLLGRDDPFVQMHNEISRLFDSFFGDTGWSVPRTLDNGTMAGVMQPQLDIFETDDRYQLAVDLPGLERDQVDLSIDEDVLIIRARKERHWENSDNGNRFHRAERRFGRFERTLSLPADADQDNISAELNNGVLEVTIPRRKDVDPVRGRRIEIAGK